VFQEINVEIPRSTVSETITPIVTGIAIDVSIPITPTAITPRIDELIAPSNPKYQVNVNIISTMIVAKIKNTVLMSTISCAGFVQVDEITSNV
jgi:hypothetical protein